VSFKIIMTTHDKIMFHKTTPDLQDQDRFFVSDQSCSKTNSLKPHHWFQLH